MPCQFVDNKLACLHVPLNCPMSVLEYVYNCHTTTYLMGVLEFMYTLYVHIVTLTLLGKVYTEMLQSYVMRVFI